MEATTYRPGDLPEGIASRIVVDPLTGCWRWQRKTGGDNPKQYGQVEWDGRIQAVHRVVYVLLVGPVPEERPFLDHVYDQGCRCKNCCFPVHLEPVTAGENLRRMWSAARQQHRDAAATSIDADQIIVGLANIADLAGYSATLISSLLRTGDGPRTWLEGRRRVARCGDVLEWSAQWEAHQTASWGGKLSEQRGGAAR